MSNGAKAFHIIIAIAWFAGAIAAFHAGAVAGGWSVAIGVAWYLLAASSTVDFLNHLVTASGWAD